MTVSIFLSSLKDIQFQHTFVWITFYVYIISLGRLSFLFDVLALLLLWALINSVEVCKNVEIIWHPIIFSNSSFIKRGGNLWYPPMWKIPKVSIGYKDEFFFFWSFFFCLFWRSSWDIWRFPGWGSNQSCSCNLHHSSWQCLILNPLSKARDWTCNLMVPSWIC